MIRPNTGQYWTTLAILALAAGSAAAADEQNSRDLEMEVVEVVERAAPAPVSQGDYFSALGAEVSAELAQELRANVAESAASSYQMLAAELELSTGTRVVVNDTEGADSPEMQEASSSGS